MQLDTVHILLLLAAAIGTICYRLSIVGKRDKELPPGPPTKFVIGNLLDIPPRYAHLKFTQWSKTYGPVISCKLFSATMVILNDAESVMEILDKRSGSSSERPPSYINAEMIANNNHVLLSTGPRSTFLRKVYNTSLAQGKVGDYLPLQHAELNATMWNILRRPEEFYTEIRRFSASLTLAITYGKRCPDFRTMDESGFSIENFYNLEWDSNFFLEVGAAPPVDLLPILKYIPSALMPWKSRALQIRKRMKEMYQYTLYEEVRRRVERGEGVGCWMEQIVKGWPELQDEEKAWIGGVMMEGGSDTTSSVLLSLVLAAVLYPDAVRKAQKELDAVVGQERSPTIEDLDALPYCRAFLLEVMRWRPAVPAGVPHRMSRDEMYNGMLIPKGAIVVRKPRLPAPQTGATKGSREPVGDYARPRQVRRPRVRPPSFSLTAAQELMQETRRQFEPERFMKHRFGLKPSLTEEERSWRNTFPYGAGRRICQGMHFAESTLKLATTKLLWAFTFSPVLDPSTGEPFPLPDNNFRPGHITAPEEFRCEIRARSEGVRRTVEEENGEGRRLLMVYERSLRL